MNVCRACISNEPTDNCVSIFTPIDKDVTMAKVLSTCTHVQIVEDDALPSLLCSECSQIIKQIHQFIQKVQLSDQKLRDTHGTEQSITTNKQKTTIDLAKLNEKHHDNDESQTNFQFSDVDKNGGGSSLVVEQFSNDMLLEEICMSELDRENDNFSSNQSSSCCTKFACCPAPKSSEKAIPQETGRWQKKHTVQEIETDGKLVCCGCLKTFNSEAEQQAHSRQIHFKKRATHKGKTNICNVCHRRYSTPKALQQHLRKIARVQLLYECTECHKRYTESSKAQQHSLGNHQGISNKLRCNFDDSNGPKICCAQACGMSFENEALLLHHSQNAHRVNKIESSLNDKREKPIECHVCFKRFETQVSLERHQRRNYKSQPYQCAACGIKFRGGEALAIHERMHRKEKPFSCETCRKSFVSKTILKAHQLTHSDVRPFVCESCGRGFRRKRNLQVHVLSHTNDQPFLCDVCPARFKAKSHLHYHMRTHTGEKPYQCRYCEKRFADHTNRARHEMSHTGIRPYKCSQCDKSFIRKRFLVEHESIHCVGSTNKS